MLATSSIEEDEAVTTITNEVGDVKEQSYLISEHVCPQCGKRFVMSVGTDIKHYAYKMMMGRRVQYMCSYHCYRLAVKAGEAQQAERKEARRKK